MNLKPCPFCGANARLYIDPGEPFEGNPGEIYVICRLCRSRGPILTWKSEELITIKALVITLWNRRI